MVELLLKNGCIGAESTDMATTLASWQKMSGGDMWSKEGAMTTCAVIDRAQVRDVLCSLLSAPARCLRSESEHTRDQLAMYVEQGLLCVCLSYSAAIRFRFPRAERKSRFLALSKTDVMILRLLLPHKRFSGSLVFATVATALSSACSWPCVTKPRGAQKLTVAQKAPCCNSGR